MADEFVPGSKEPTEKQKTAGNYQKGHRSLHGMRISIENAAGTIRRGIGRDGKPWESVMPLDYGYIRGSKGKDKDALDVFLGPEADNPDHHVYVIDQDKEDGTFDEHKCLIGFPSSSDAYEAYHSAYPDGHNGFRAITALPLAGFRRWAGMGVSGGKRKRLSELAGADAFSRGGAVAPAAGSEAAPAGAGSVPVAKGARSAAAGSGVDEGKLEAHFSRGAAGRPDDECGCGNETVMFTGPSNGEARGFAGGGLVAKAVEELPKVASALKGFLSKEGAFSDKLAGVPATAENTEQLPKLLKQFQKKEGVDPASVNLVSSGSNKPLDPSLDHDVWGLLPPYSNQTFGYANPQLTAHINASKGAPLPPTDPDAVVRLFAQDPRSVLNVPIEWGGRRVASDGGPRTRDEILQSLEAQRLGNIAKRDELLKRIAIYDRPPSDPDYVPSAPHYVDMLKRELARTADAGSPIPGLSADSPPTSFSLEKFDSPMSAKLYQRTADRIANSPNPKRITFPMVEQQQIYTPSLRDAINAGSMSGVGFADGGEVDEDLSKPAFRTPMILKRREDRQDREGAKQVPLGLARGALAGTLGFGGDMEGIGRSLAKMVGADVDSTPALPTSDFYRDVLPLKPDSAAGKAAEGVGTSAGVPLSAPLVAGVRGASKAAPIVRGALTQMAENAAAANVPGRLSKQAGVIILPGSGTARPFRDWTRYLGGDNLSIPNQVFSDARSMSDATGRTNLEHGGEAFLEEVARSGVPMKSGQETSVSFPTAFMSLMDRYNGKPPKIDNAEVLNVHTHPHDALPMPSGPTNVAGEERGRTGDVGHWFHRAGNGDKDEADAFHALIVGRPLMLDGSNRLTYSARSFENPDLMDPRFGPIANGGKYLAEQVKKGAFDPQLRDALDDIGQLPKDEYLQIGRNLLSTSRYHLPQSALDARELSSSAYDLASPFQNAVIQRAFPRAREILESDRPNMLDGYAAGGPVSSIGAGNTVGLGSFNPSANNVGAARPAQAVNPYATAGALTQANNTGGGLAQSQYGSGLTDGSYNGSLPTAVNNLKMGDGGAPTYSDAGLDAYMGVIDSPDIQSQNLDFNKDPWGAITSYMKDPYTMQMLANPSGFRSQEANKMDPALRTTLTAGNQGVMRQGINAFLGNYQPNDYGGYNSDTGSYENKGEGYSKMYDLANNLGLKLSGTTDADKYNDLNNQLKNYYTIGGLSAGWNGEGMAQPRGASQTMYLRQNGKLVPVSTPARYTAMKSSDINRANNMELVQAASVMAPMISYWAAPAVAAATGTTAAAAAPYTTAAINMGLGAAQGGVKGALSSLASSAGGAAAGFGAAGSGYEQAARALGSKGASYLFGQLAR